MVFIGLRLLLPISRNYAAEDIKGNRNHSAFEGDLRKTR